MEKRLIIAFIVSFIFIKLWAQAFPSAQPAALPGNQQVVANRELSAEIPTTTPAVPAVPAASMAPPQETLSVLENDKLRLETSSLGARIQTFEIKEFKEFLPVSGGFVNKSSSGQEFELGQATDQKLVYVLNDGDFSITRSYELGEDDYMVRFEETITNNTGIAKKSHNKYLGFFLDISRLDKKVKESRDRSLMEYSVSGDGKVLRKSNAFKFNDRHQKSKFGRVDWAAFRNRYFCLILKPQFETDHYFIEPKGEEGLEVLVSSPDVEIPARGQVVHRAQIYVGPQDLDLLRSYDIGIQDVMKFSNIGVFDAIAKVIYSGMRGLRKIIPSWGVCIILMALLVNGFFYPLTLKSMTSMKKMQSIQPHVTELRERYKNNPQRLNKEIMELYKEHKVNPLGGCLPMLLQIPIFFGLYQVLWRSVSLKGSGFLWIKDLSEPDRLAMLPTSLPVIGNEINVLPFVMGLLMFVQQKFSSKNMSAADPAQVQQQKMMMIMFPIMMLFIFYKAASGLTLYFVVMYVFTTFTQWKISKMTKVG